MVGSVTNFGTKTCADFGLQLGRIVKYGLNTKTPSEVFSTIENKN